MDTEIVEGEIVHVPQENVQLGMLEVRPEDVVKRATGIANALKDVIVEQNLFTRIGNSEHVRVEGWATLGAMLGILPMEEWSRDLDGQGYETYVALVRASDGIKIGGASAICMRTEKNWQDRDDYAVRSMSGTRATGKAFRLALSWIMKLAGYHVTPAEEMLGNDKEPKKKSGNKKPRAKSNPEPAFRALIKKLEFTDKQAQEFIDAADGDFAKAFNNLSKQHVP